MGTALSSPAYFASYRNYSTQPQTRHYRNTHLRINNLEMSDFVPPSGPPPPKVPEGWKAQWNEQYSEWFYVNIYTKKSQWDKPTEPVYPPPSDGAPPSWVSVLGLSWNVGGVKDGGTYTRSMCIIHIPHYDCAPKHTEQIERSQPRDIRC